MGRCLWTYLDRVHPDFSHEMRDLQECKGIQTATRRFALQDLVYAQNWGREPEWLEVIIVVVIGLLSYIILASKGLKLQCHIDQLCVRYSSAAENVDGPCNPLESDVGVSSGA
ncbi:hypothetical protein PR048_016525 [Dryococelus australis]|uniref:Uncharacterized protein n=1 Tax=Dryococelus australis TaxID=614101 RepID=A0ABQ9HJY8_9NEOP|nr:hypothetical protein PR048_016525 [Dryococelus australis]